MKKDHKCFVPSVLCSLSQGGMEEGCTITTRDNHAIPELSHDNQCSY